MSQAWLRAAPWLTGAAFALPVAAGLLGTLLPAFGHMPAIGVQGGSLQAWRALWAEPGFASSLQLTLRTGLLATALSVLLALGLVAAALTRPWGRRLAGALAPVLAMPHSALAIALAFLIAPSGWLVRWVSPGLTGWAVPPDVATVGHPWGLALVAGLLLKEVPYLALMALGALNQIAAPAQMNAARAMGHAPATAFLKVVLPQLWPQIRLPVFAVLAFSLSVVDVALVLGPDHPPTLAVLAVRWFSAPDIQRYPQAAAAAVLLLGLVLACMLAWQLLERALAPLGRRWVEGGSRRGAAGPAVAMAAGLSLGGVLLSALAVLALVLWSLAEAWPYPDALPSGWTLAHWQRQAGSLLQPAIHTLVVALSATLLALVLTLACLENETRRGLNGTPARRVPGRGLLWLLYLPLLVPQVAFLFGAQVLLVRAGIDATTMAVVLAHLVFVLPYLYLSLADPWRAFDARYARSAASLGAPPWRVFWRVKLPILLKPTLLACAVALAVSVGQYLPTLFAGSGRIATLTTEAVTLSSGQDRRVSAIWALLQAALPWLGFVLAGLLPRWLFAGRRGMA